MNADEDQQDIEEGFVEFFHIAGKTDGNNGFLFRLGGMGMGMNAKYLRLEVDGGNATTSWSPSRALCPSRSRPAGS